jgi:hypothetical protein
MIRRTYRILALALAVVFAYAATAIAAPPAEYATGEPANVTPYPLTHTQPALQPALQRRGGGTSVGPQPCTGDGTISAAQTYYGFGYLANQVAQAYDLDPYYQEGDEGQGQTIALLELEPNRAEDIDAYQGCYGTDATVNYIAVDGGISGSGTDTTDPGAGEAALDIEQIVGLAPKATVDVYQAPNTESGVLDAYQEMVDNPAVTIISTSWGACEAGNPLAELETATLASAAQSGISIFAAAGDNGSTDCGTSAPAVDDPASNPYVTGVGGTTMPSVTAVGQQFAWNGSSIGEGVSGGGFSSLWGEPSWQDAATVQAQATAATHSELTCPGALGGGYCRAVPDVSADADPYTGYIIYLTQDVTDPDTGITSPQITAIPWGGTSAAAPLWAAMTALINASPDCNGHNLGFLNPLLYDVSVTGMPGLTDITAGNNDNSADSPAGFFTAGRGYDAVTGLGTPIAATLGQSLCADADTLTLTAPSAETNTYGQAVNVTSISANDAQGHSLTYSAAGLPAGLSMDPNTGTISGTPTANANATVRVTVTAAANNATKTTVIPWTVTGAPSTTPPPTGGTGTTTTGTGTTGSGQQQGGGGGAKTPKPRVIHVTRHYRGHTIRLTLTVTGNTAHQHLVVSYTDKRGRGQDRFQLAWLVLKPQAKVGRSKSRAVAHLVVLAVARKTTGRVTISLTPTRIARGVEIDLRYGGGRQDLVPLPRL